MQDSDKQISTTPSSNRSLWVVIILLSTLLVSLAAGGYWAYERYKAMNGQLASLLEQQSKLGLAASQSDKTLGALKDQQTADHTLLSQFSEQQQSHNKQLIYLSEQLSGLTGIRRQDWEIARLEYLLKLASQRLQLDGDLSGAKATLLAADEYLKLLDEPKLIPVRKQVSKDLLALNQAERVDRTGLYLSLESLIDGVPSLQPVEPVFEMDATHEELINQEQGFADWLLSKLKNMVRLTSNEVTPVASWLSGDSREQFNLMLVLRLMHAQQAVMSEDQALYEVSLKRAKALIEQVYAGRSHSQGMMNELTRLETKQVSMADVDISGSHQALKSYLEHAQQAIRETMMRKLISHDSEKDKES
jgi:uroporphyrin-3 C-methyltransferase